MVRQTDRMTDRCALTMRMSPLSCTTRSSWRPTWWSTGWRPPSSTDCNPSDYFMWCIVEREVTKCPHITLASLKVMTSEVMTDLDREVIINACKKSWSWIEAVMEATGIFIIYMHINFPWKFHQYVFTLTITFIVLNVLTEFVLIYRPHPVLLRDEQSFYILPANGTWTSGPSMQMGRRYLTLNNVGDILGK